ncbi:Crp/Fnr family transcriptional regulator [Sphingobacterium hungaricum]|uniref:Crp/Fnr family transcriptional regulator n=1 Tax=Sphingobacterium hungaricum TaxID=2082723 RepID=A0A928UWZ5_9SPHI|nr:Crp/Fnr family transcriptional regulator [Sphingobacterium hungaricum]MBE8712129.1 Crp/Fnr family transcriptional regulator [Sphingobacterium hungaricum]
MNAFLTHLKKYGYISDELEEAINQRTKRVVRQKGDYFLKQGQVVSSLFLIEQGLIRAFYVHQGREINLWFGFENYVLGSILPVYFNEPSFENIQFLEETTLVYISSSDLNELYDSYREMNLIGRKMAEEICKILEKRALSLQIESAEERYKTLLASDPEAIHRISLGNIASYLGIAQETLSRIRGK